MEFSLQNLILKSVDRRIGKVNLNETKTALFLGRIHQKKGLLMLVEAWARVRPQGWRLVVAGPDEAAHKIKVEKAVEEAGLSHVVSFTGPIQGRAKESLMFDASLLVLPTHSENFGMVVAEALAHGLPVLTTTGAPWSGLPKVGCGWWVDVSVDGIAEGLRQATRLEAKSLREMGLRGRKWVETEFSWSSVANQFIASYESLLKRSKNAAAGSRLLNRK